MIERRLQEVVLAQEKIVTDERTKCLLGLVYTCGLLPFLFKYPGACAERRIRCLCDFGFQLETPVGNAYAYIRRWEEGG